MIPKFFYNLEHFATRPQTVQRDEFVSIVTKVPTVSAPLDNGSRGLYVDKEIVLAKYKAILGKITNPKNWKAHLQEYKKVVFEMEKISNKMKRSVSEGKSNRELAYVLEEWLNVCDDFSIFIMVPFAIEKILDDECRSLLQQEFGEKESEVFNIISSPSELNNYQKMRIKICEEAISNKNNKNAYKKLAEQFSWYNEYSYVESLLDEKYFKEEVKKLSKTGAKKEKEKIIGKIAQNKDAFKKLKIKNKRLNIISEIIHAYTFLRTERIEHFKKAQTNMRSFYDEVAKRITKKTGENFSRFHTANFLNKELLDFLGKNKVPDYGDINRRLSHNYVYYFNKKKPTILYQKKEIELILKIIKSIGEQNNYLKGFAAFGGKVRGKVAVVLSKKDSKKIKRGDIMVARTTMPDFTPAIKIASAIITEEGGITSHAAIVSREFKIPCILGIKNATSVLKDGDFVEVDANKGVVKIVKRLKIGNNIKHV